MNHLEPSLKTVLEFIGITTVHSIAIENQEAGDELLAVSVAEAKHQVNELVGELQETFPGIPTSWRQSVVASEH